MTWAGEPRRLRLTSADGTALSLCEFGAPGLGAPILFVHGSFGHARVWDFVIGALPVATHGFALDLRGHGESGWAAAPEGYAFDRLAEDIEAAVRMLPRTPLLVAHSMGAAVAMQYAGTRPGAVTGCVFIDIDPRIPPHQVEHLNGAGAAGSKRYPDFERAVARQARAASKAAPEVRRHLAEHSFALREGEWVERFDPAFLRTLTQWDVRPYLPGIAVPTLVLRSGLQSVMTDEGYRALLSAIPRVTGQVVAEGTHQMHLDAPGPTAAAVSAFHAATSA